VMDDTQLSAAFLAMFPQIAKNATDKSRNDNLALSFGVAEAVDAREAITTDRDAKTDFWKQFDAVWNSNITSKMLDPFTRAASDDRYAKDILLGGKGQGLAPLIKTLAEHAYFRGGSSADPMTAIDDALKQVRTSVMPIRTGAVGSNRWGFFHPGGRVFENNPIQWAVFGISDDQKQWGDAVPMMLDVSVNSSVPKGLATMNPLLQTREALASSFFGNYFGYAQDTRGASSLASNERIQTDPILFGLGNIPTPFPALNTFLSNSSIPRWENFGSANLDWGSMYFVNGNEKPISVVDSASLEHSSWVPREYSERVKGWLKGKESVHPEVATAILVGQSRVWQYNAENGTMELFVQAASVNGVKQPGSLMQIKKRTVLPNGRVMYAPVAVSLTDIGLGYDIGRQKDPGIMDSGPWNIR
jgi:hypothetical protein